MAAILQAIVAKLWKMRRENITFRNYASELIEENKWRAVRFGLSGKLIDFGKQQELPAADLIRELLEWFIGDVVDELGSRREVESIRWIPNHDDDGSSVSDLHSILRSFADRLGL